MNFFKTFVLSIICMITGFTNCVKAQVSMTALGTVYTQNFNGLTTSGSTTWSNNSTISNWYAARTGSGTLSVLASSGSVDTRTMYSYGTGTNSDRALGFIPGGDYEDMIAGVRLENNTGSTIKALTITYTVEQWRIDGSENQEIDFSYRTSNSSLTSLTSGSWTDVNSLDFSSAFTGEQGAVDGNASAYRETISYTIYNVNLADGYEIMLRWYLPNPSGRNGVGIDDLTIVASNPTVYYSKSSGNLNLTSSWGTNAAGSGTNPSNFTSNDVLYIIANNATPTLGANWTVSGTGSKVVLGNGSSAVNFTIPSSYSFTGNIDLADNATLTVNNSTLPTIGSMATTSTLILGASGAQTIPGGTYYTLTVAGGGTKTLGGATYVRTQLTFTSGKLSLGNYSLTLASDATISGASSSNYVITDGTGSLIRNVENTSTSVAFPIGTSSGYNPATLSQSGSGTTDNFGLRVYSGVSTSYNSSDVATGTAITSDVVTKTWAITEETAGGSNTNITLQWNASDEGTSFSRSSCFVAHYTGGAWTTASTAAASGSGPYTRQLTGVTSFSPFSISDNVGALPVRLVSFSGKPGDTGNELEWITASETNNKGFEVERRDELTGEFVFIGFVSGHGTTSNITNYIYNDDLTQSAYYRLKQVDFDGRFEYSQVVFVDRSNVNSTYSNGNVSLNIYPNPAVNSVSVEVMPDSDWELNVKLLDIEGKEVIVPMKEKSADGKKMVLDVSGVQKGVYFIESVNGRNKFSQKLLIL